MTIDVAGMFIQCILEEKDRIEANEQLVESARNAAFETLTNVQYKFLLRLGAAQAALEDEEKESNN